jgi:hypothetical protein
MVYIRECTVCFNNDVMFSGVFQDWPLLGIDIWVE